MRSKMSRRYLTIDLAHHLAVEAYSSTTPAVLEGCFPGGFHALRMPRTLNPFTTGVTRPVGTLAGRRSMVRRDSTHRDAP